MTYNPKRQFLAAENSVDDLDPATHTMLNFDGFYIDLWDYMIRKEITTKFLADQLGVSEDEAFEIRRGGKDLTTHELRLLAAALGLVFDIQMYEQGETP